MKNKEIIESMIPKENNNSTTNVESFSKPLPVDVYYVFVRCSNCHLKQTIHINYGTTVDNTLCPHCKCKSVFVDVKHTNYIQ